MKIKCDYCGSMIDETNNNCPHCGAQLSGVNRMASQEPKTIEELQQWYTDHHLPPEKVTRFFIGKDIKEARAFGIYRDHDGDIVVYKNKGNGERAVRYKGADEAYAVNELYQRLRSEIVNQKQRNAQTTKSSGSGSSNVSGKRRKRRKNRSSDLSGWAGIAILASIFIVSIAITMIFDKNTPYRGYYRYNNTDYYYQNDIWYYYDDTSSDWFITSTPSDLLESENIDDYRTYSVDGKRFEDTHWYVEPSDDYDDDSWDNDYDWDDGDSWDNDSMDWDSDW